MDSLHEESVDINLDSVANVAGGSSNSGQIGFKFESSNDQNPFFSINASDDEDFVNETLETEPIDDASEVGKCALSNATPHEIENPMIITRNSFDADNSNDGQVF